MLYLLIYLFAGVHQVTEYGPFTAGSTDQAVKQQNKQTINRALEALAAEGGGTLQVPEGIYYFPAGGHAITIRGSNITLRGAGMYKTIFRTNGTWDTATRSRSPGLLVAGSKDPGHPQRNIVLQDFELDGQSGWTGEYRWWTPEERKNGWDITHHGMDIAIDTWLDSVLIENVYVHRFKGELLYTGGMHVGKLTLRHVRSEDTNASTWNLYGAEALMDSCEFGGPCRFWAEACARANQIGYPHSGAVFRDCHFHDARGDNGAIALAQGDSKTYSYTFERCRFENTAGYGLFMFCGGVAGPVIIRDNIIRNCDGTRIHGFGAVLDFEWGGGTVDSSKVNSHIEFAHNTVYSSGGPLIDMSGSWIGKMGPEVIRHVAVKDNVFHGSDSTEVMTYGAQPSWNDHEMTEIRMEDVSVTGNTFIHCKPPRQIGPVLGEGPVIKDNTYRPRDADAPVSGVEAARQVLVRALGQTAAARFRLVLQPSGESEDHFTTAVAGGKVVVTGNTPVALCRGAYDYLKRTGQGIVSWSGARADMPGVLPAYDTSVTSPYRYRYYLNVVTHGYSAAYWDWARWEKEIDWMALHGMNMPLLDGAHEAIIQRVFKKIGFTGKEIQAYFTGPAFFPWNRMGNITGWDGPFPASFLPKQIRLNHLILRRLRELGMHPIIPAFAGFVPEGIKRLYPGEKLRQVGDAGTNILEPGSDLFIRIGRLYITEWEKEFGRNEFFLADSFNEMNVPVSADSATAARELEGYGRSVFRSIHEADPDAVWVMQGWTFPYYRVNGRRFWTPARLKALFSGVPDNKLLVLDLANEYNRLWWKIDPSWKIFDGFFGKQWIYSFVPNMGGKVALNGRLDLYASMPAEALAYPGRGKLVGFGFAPEGIGNNEIIYELLSDIGWTKTSIDLDSWIPAYCRQRYGAFPAKMRTAFDHLRKSCYGSFTDHPRFRWQLRPDIDFAHLMYDFRSDVHSSEDFREGVRAFLECRDELKGSALYRADAIELAAQFLGLKADELLQTFRSSGDKALLDSGLRVMEAIDRLLASHPEHRLQPLIDQARAYGDTRTEKDYYEMDAKRLLTTWGPNPDLDDYAAKAWNGLIHSYYIPRWRQYYGKGSSFDLKGWEEKWIRTPLVIEAQPFTDPLSEVYALFRRYDGPMTGPGASGTGDAPALRGFQPRLLKVETSTDQLQPGETAWLTCWWQNTGDAPSTRPLTVFVESALGHQRILETLPRCRRSYFEPYPSTTSWQPGGIWKTTIRMSPPSWGGTYHLTIGLCDEEHRTVMQAKGGEIDVSWGWGQPTVERMRRARVFGVDTAGSAGVSPKPAADNAEVSQAPDAVIDLRPGVRLSKDMPALLSFGPLNNIRGSSSPLVVLRDYATDHVRYSSERDIQVEWSGLGGDSSYNYTADVSDGSGKLARFVLHYRLHGRQLRITMDSIWETPGCEFLEVRLPSLLSTSGKNSALVDFSGGGRYVPLDSAAPMGFTHPYDTRNAAGLITPGGQVSLESSCLDDRLVEAVCENAAERTAELGMVLVHRVKANGKVHSIPVEDDHCIRLDVPGKEWGRPSWQSLAKYWRQGLRRGNSALYKDALVYKILATEGPEPPPGRVTEDASYSVKRLTNVRKFRDMPDKMRQLYNVLDGMPQVVYIGGWQKGGFDNSYPFVFDTDERAGSIQELKDCIREGRKYNAIVGLHDNYDDVSPGEHYDPRIVSMDENGQPCKGWIWAGGLSHIVSPYKYFQSGLMAQRVRRTVELYGLQKTGHLDVLSSEPLRYDFDSACPAGAERSLQGKLAIIDAFNKEGLDITSETLTHPFVGHIGYALWTRDDPKAVFFKGERCIPLIQMVYHGTIAYDGPSEDDTQLLWNLVKGCNYFPGETFFTDKDIGNIYLQQLPLRGFYDKKIDSFYNADGVMKAIYDPHSYVRVDLNKKQYTVVCNGQLVAKDWSSFTPGFRPGTWLAFSRKGGHFDFPLPPGSGKKWRAVSLTREGEGKMLRCRVVDGHIGIDMPAGVPVRVWPVKEAVSVRYDVVYGQSPDDYGRLVPLRLDVYAPVAAGSVKRPVVLFVHGGGFGGGDKAQDLYRMMANRFAGLGYLAFSVNYRLKQPSTPCGKPVLDSASADVLQALRWIRRHGAELGVDTSKIIICGDSAGGAIAVNMSLDPANNGFFAGCIDLWGGMCDPEDPYFLHRPPWDQPIYPFPVSPGAPPVCMIHGTAETVVPLSTSRELSARLDSAGIYNELHLLQGADHYPEQMAETFIPWMIAFAGKILHKPG